MARPKRCWSVQVGAPGHRVTALERKPGGSLYVRWWVPGAHGSRGQWTWRALRHTDRAAAEATARAIAAQLLTGTLSAETGRTTVAEVFAVYENDVAKHLKGAGLKEAQRRIALWSAFLGADRDVVTVDFPTCDRFVRERRAGRIVVPGHVLKATPSDRAIEADFTFLQAAFNHATRVVRPNGKRLLEINPIRGYKAPRNKAPKRPVATYDRYEAVVAQADTVDPQGLFRGFMGLLEGLGWRVSALCGLAGADLDLGRTKTAPHGRIYKRPSLDKEGSGGWVPMSESVRAAVDEILTRNAVLGDRPLFPAPRSKPGGPPRCWSRYHARALLERAEAAAGLDPLVGSDFHAYRRKWATERKHLPAQDVAAAGAWGDLRSLETAYTHSDEATILAVMTEPRKLSAAR